MRNTNHPVQNSREMHNSLTSHLIRYLTRSIKRATLAYRVKCLTRCDKFHYWNCGALSRRGRAILRDVIILSTDAMQFCFISRKRVIMALQDQSSHLSTILKIPDLYFTTVGSCFVLRLFVCVCILYPICVPPFLFPFLQIFTLDFLIFTEAMMRKPRVSRDDYSEWSREIFPGCANSTVRDCSASSIFQRDSPTSSVIRESSFCLGFFSGRCPFFLTRQSVNREIYSFPW